MTPGGSGIPRGVGAVLLAYLALIGIILGGFTVLWKTTTLDDLFEDGSFVPRTFVVVFSLVLGAFAAFVAGYLCAGVAGSRRPAYVFAGIIGALGLITLCFSLTAAKPEPRPRTGSETLEEVQVQAEAMKPIASKLAEPAVGVVGILLGARWKLRSSRL
jgi:hypothetical protein